MWAFSRFVRYFETVARLGSMRRAGDALHISASSIHRQILQIEHKIGVPLFDRLPDGLKLTAAGELVLHKLRLWQRDMSGLMLQIEAIKGVRRGYVRFGLVEGASAEFASRIVADFHHIHPGINYNFAVSGAAQIVQWVLDGNVDFGLSVNPVETHGLRILETVTFNIGVITPPDHPLAKLHAIRLSACAGEPFILADHTLALRAVVDQLLAHTAINPTIIAESNHISVVKDLIMRGMGIGLLTRMDIWREIENATLVYIPLLDRALQPSVLSLCVAADRQLSLASASLLQYFVDALRKNNEGQLKP